VEQERRELRTWKQIANHLGWSIRTVQDYETQAGLPVHRLAGKIKGPVLAYADELDAWKSKALARGTSATEAPDDSEPVLPAPLSAFPFSGGHWRYGSLLFGLFALMWAEAVVLEVAYQFAGHGAKALLASPVVFAWVLATLLSALMADWWRTAKSKTGGLFLSISIVYGSAALLQAALTSVLPATPVTEQIARQPWTAQAAYLKNVALYFLPMATFYILLPFHFVIALQRELAARRPGPVLALLTGQRKAPSVVGAIYLRVSRLAWALFATALLSVVMTEDLFDHLKPNHYKELFIWLVLGRTLLLFGVAVLWLLWYSKSLDEIELECLRDDAVIVK